MTPVVVLCHQVQVQNRLVSLTTKEREGERQKLNQFVVYFVTSIQKVWLQKIARGYKKSMPKQLVDKLLGQFSRNLAFFRPQSATCGASARAHTYVLYSSSNIICRKCSVHINIHTLYTSVEFKIRRKIHRQTAKAKKRVNKKNLLR